MLKKYQKYVHNNNEPVLVPPDIVYDETSSDMSVQEGENATLICKANGHPPPRITWRREDNDPIILRKGPRDTVKGAYLIQYV